MIQTIQHAGLPECLRRIHGAPKQLFVNTHDSQTFDRLMDRPRVAIVGSRKVSTYGEAVTAKLASELAAHGVVIVSGLAIGVDGIAHRAALQAGGLCIAVLPGPLDSIHPRSHYNLSQQILEHGGALVSEYPEGTVTYKTNFVARNRIVAGLSDGLLITEAAERSGTLHTANFAMEQGVDVYAVPGNITSQTSVGTNNLIKSCAIPVTETADVLQGIGITTPPRKGEALHRLRGSNSDEQQLLNLLEEGVFDGNQLLNKSGFSVEQFNHHLTMLEITAKVRPLGANQWGLR